MYVDNTCEKYIVNTNAITGTLAKSIADTNTNTFATICFTVFTFSNVHFFAKVVW